MVLSLTGNSLGPVEQVGTGDNNDLLAVNIDGELVHEKNLGFGQRRGRQSQEGEDDGGGSLELHLDGREDLCVKC